MKIDTFLGVFFMEREKSFSFLIRKFWRWGMSGEWLSFLGTLVGTFGGIMISNRLTNYRIEQLEKKVDKHNTIIERTFRLEEKVRNLEEDVKAVKK